MLHGADMTTQTFTDRLALAVAVLLLAGLLLALFVLGTNP